MAGFVPIRVLGCMSGTSMDAVDGAVVVTDGEGQLAFGPTVCRPFGKPERAAIRAALGQWPGGPDVAAAAAVVEAAHSDMIGGFAGLDLIGFHGQTLAHDPDGGRTHQAGDPARLGAACPVVWDFRSADMAAGGVGAPLAPFFHHALMRKAGLDSPVAVLNLGGVANVTYVDPRLEAPEAPGALLAFDCGPANALMDDLATERLGADCDLDGAAAAAGRVNKGAVERAMGAAFFARPAPKAADRGDFASIMADAAAMSAHDAMATLAAFTVAGVAAGAAMLPAPVAAWYVTGGGRRNGFVMRALAETLRVPVRGIEDLGYDGDALEAQAFGWLAVRALRGLPLSAPGTTGCRAPVTGGRLCRPGEAGASQMS